MTQPRGKHGLLAALLDKGFVLNRLGRFVPSNMSEQVARRDDERRLYGTAQHESNAGADPEARYGEPQHETDAENPFSTALIEGAEPKPPADGDRSPDSDAGRARARPAGD